MTCHIHAIHAHCQATHIIMI